MWLADASPVRVRKPIRPRRLSMPTKISRFQIEGSGEDYLLTFETEDGDSIELAASYEQLDLIAEAIDAQLDSDEEDALGVDAQED
jgi:hypothetical protein